MKLVYIEWCDAVGISTAWMTIAEVKEWANDKNWLVKQTGFIIEENERYLLLAGKVHEYDPEEPQVGNVMKIPTTWIQKRIDLSDEVTSA